MRISIALGVLILTAGHAARAESCDPNRSAMCRFVVRHFMADNALGVRRADGTTLLPWAMRMGLGGDVFYAMVEIEMSPVLAGAPLLVTRSNTDSLARSTPQHGMPADMAAAIYVITGIRVPLGSFAISLETAAGGRELEASTASPQVFGPWQNVLEGRGRIERRLSQHVGIGAFAGASLVGHADWTAGTQVVFRFGKNLSPRQSFDD